MKKLIFIIFLFAFSLTGQAQSTKFSSISGKILSVNGLPVKGIQIELRNYSVKDKEVKNNFFWEGKARVDNTPADNTGKYEFRNLPESDYYLSIEFPQKMEKVYEYVKKPDMPIKLGRGQDIKNADYTLNQVRTVISGKVYKRDAITPYTDMSLELSCNDKIYSSAVTDEKGGYVFAVEPAAGQWKINVKGINKIVLLNMDLSKINTFENMNIICEK